MAFTISAILLLASFAIVHPLCTPDQWEGYEGSLGAYADREKHGMIKEYMSIHYDYTNKRSAVFLDYVNGDYENKFKILVHYKDDVGALFVVDLKKDSCWMKKLEQPFRKICIPEGAKKKYDYYLGLYGGLKLTSYEVEKYDLTSIISVETKGDVIIPVTESVYGRLGRVDFVQGLGFVDIQAGIKNETVFDIPEECELREEVSMSEQLTREHYILAL